MWQLLNCTEVEMPGFMPISSLSKSPPTHSVNMLLALTVNEYGYENT